jgi:diketogulonate reductase-like aldo/keto reductase
MSSRVPTQSLRNGAEISVLGRGTWPLRGDQAAAQVRTAIEAGYRLIDTAENYRNEESVGQGIRESGIERSELFVTTKFDRELHSDRGADAVDARLVGEVPLQVQAQLLLHAASDAEEQVVGSAALERREQLRILDRTRRGESGARYVASPSATQPFSSS